MANTNWIAIIIQAIFLRFRPFMCGSQSGETYTAVEMSPPPVKKGNNKMYILKKY